MELKTSQAGQLDGKLRPVCKIENPKSMNTHYLNEFANFNPDVAINIDELNPFLADTLFKVDPSPLKNYLAAARTALSNLDECNAMYGIFGGDKHKLSKTIEAAELTQKESTILGTCVSQADKSVLLKRAVRNATSTDVDGALSELHLVENHFGKPAAKKPKVS